MRLRRLGTDSLQTQPNAGIHRRARKPACTDFLPPDARIARRVVFGSDYEDGRRVHSSEPSSACAVAFITSAVFDRLHGQLAKK